LISLYFTLIAGSVGQDGTFNSDVRILLSTLLENGYQVKLAEQDNILYQGQLKSYEGRFDYYLGLHGGGLTSNMTLSPENAELFGVKKLITNEYYYGAGLSKQFDFGLSIEPRLTFSQTEYKISGVKPFNTGSVDFVFNLPLLRGLGKNIDAANVENASNTYQAALDNYHFTISTEFYNSLVSYINYLGTIQMNDAYQLKMNRADSLLDITRLLVEKDELAASEIRTIEAYRSEANLKLLSTGVEINDLKAEIGKILGVDLNDFIDLSLTSRTLPDIIFLFNPDTGFINRSIQIAYLNRKDIEALEKIQTGSGIMLEAMEKNKLPELNLELDVGYNGYDEGVRFSNYYSPFYNNVGGANIQATIRYKMPFANSKAIGDYLSQKAILEQINLQKRQMENATAIEISTIVNNLIYLSAEYQKANASVNLYLEVLADQLIKLRLEKSTFVEYFTVEDKLMEVYFTKVRIEIKLLKEILKYKLATGLLIEKRNDQYTLNIEKLFTLIE